MTQAIQAMRAGGPEVLEFNEVDTPQPSPGEVLVNVEAAGVNFIDTYEYSLRWDPPIACAGATLLIPG